MLSMNELLHEVEQLPVDDRWRLVKYVLSSLEREQIAPNTRSDYHQFLKETYGSLRDTPIERGEQGGYDQREPLE